MGMAAKLVKKALGVHNSQTDDNKRDKVLKKRSSAEQIQQPVRPNLGASLDNLYYLLAFLSGRKTVVYYFSSKSIGLEFVFHVPLNTLL